MALRVSLPQVAARGTLPGARSQRCVVALASAAPSATAQRYFRLQNGSDVRGVALEGVEGQAVTLTSDCVAFLGVAFAKWLSAQSGKPVNSLRISIGSDPRLSGPALTEALAAGIASTGASVVPLGLCTTPACFMSCITAGHAYDGSCMLTASHLPWNRRVPFRTTHRQRRTHPPAATASSSSPRRAGLPKRTSPRCASLRHRRTTPRVA